MFMPEPGHARISAIGTYVPERVLTNADLERMVETNDEWIVRRTGIRERRIAAEDQYTGDLCASAVEAMIRRYDVNLKDVDFILAATHTPDLPFPGVSAMLQHRFSIEKAGAVDFHATCAGFVYGLQLADALIRSGLHRKILLVAGDTMSKITDYTDRSTCILFGDGAGAVLVERDEEADSPNFLAFDLGSEGQGGVHVYRTGLSRRLGGADLIPTGKVVQNGREVYRWAVNLVPEGMRRLFESGGLGVGDIDWFVPHSANLRIIESICEKSGFPLEKTLYSLEDYGNTSAATIPLSLDLGLKAGKIAQGQKLLLYGFGGGLVYAGMILKWRI